MVDKTTSFEKGKGGKGNFMISKPVVVRMKKPKVKPKPETKCLYYEGNGH